MTVDRFTLYSAEICPYAQRVRIALHEAKADFKEYEIDLGNKPEWYAPKVNPASKVPAIAYGGPDVAPDQPSPESTKIAESLVLLEFVADLYPSSGLLPSSPVERAQTRFFIDTVGNKLLASYFAFSFGTSKDEDKGIKALFDGVTAVQELLVAQSSGPYFNGDKFTIADAAVAPFLIRIKMLFNQGLGKFDATVAKNFVDTVFNDAKYSRFASYWDALASRPSVKDTFIAEEKLIAVYRKRLGL